MVYTLLRTFFTRTGVIGVLLKICMTENVKSTELNKKQLKKGGTPLAIMI